MRSGMGMGMGIPGLPAGGFSPLDIENLRVWFDAKQGITLGDDQVARAGGVSVWTDVKSGRLYEQATPANQPVIVPGSHMQFRLADSTFMTRAHSMGDATEFTTVYVMRLVSNPSTMYIQSHEGQGGHTFLRIASTGTRAQMSYGTTLEGTTQLANLQSHFRVIVFYANKTAQQGTVTVYGGVNTGDGIVTATGAIGSRWYNAAKSIFFGRYYDLGGTGSFLNADVASIMNVNGVISELDMANLLDFLVAYYGANITPSR